MPPPRIKNRQINFFYNKSVMSVRKLIKIRSAASKSPNYNQKHLKSTNFEYSSVDTLSLNNLDTQGDLFCYQLFLKNKKLTQHNDRLWKLLTQSTDHHQECPKIQKKLKSNLECAQRQLSFIQQMYYTQRQNYQQSKLFYHKRQIQWQRIISHFKTVIEDYEQTKEVNMQKASEIFNQTAKMQSSLNLVSLLKYQQQHNQNKTIYQRRTVDSQIKTVEQHPVQFLQNMNSMEKKGKTIDKVMPSKLQRNISVNKKDCQSIKTKKFNEKQAKEDTFERALRRTYAKIYRIQKLRTNQILESSHLQKLKLANSSTRQRLNKTIKKMFVFDSPEQLEQIIKYIQDKVYDQYKIVRGDLVFNFLKDKFIQCEEIFLSSSSVLNRLDREPTNILHQERQFPYQKSPEVNVISPKNNSKINQRAQIPIRSIQNTYVQTESLFKFNGLQLNINSNIKQNPEKCHFNNHIKNSIISKNQSQRQLGGRELLRDQSKKNIYNDKIVCRRKFIQQKSKFHKSRSNDQSLERTRNLSSLIGVNEQYGL